MTLHEMRKIFPRLRSWEIWYLRQAGSKEYLDGHLIKDLMKEGV